MPAVDWRAMFGVIPRLDQLKFTFKCICTSLEHNSLCNWPDHESSAGTRESFLRLLQFLESGRCSLKFLRPFDAHEYMPRYCEPCEYAFHLTASGRKITNGYGSIANCVRVIAIADSDVFFPIFPFAFWESTTTILLVVQHRYASI